MAAETSTYPGWQSDLLTVAHLPDTKDNRAFLTDWKQHAETTCRLNPVDLTARNSGSHNCKSTGRAGVSYQRYSDRVWTRTAFAAQIGSGRYEHLRSALESGSPYDVDYWADVASDLNRWRAFKFATAYLLRTRTGVPQPNTKAAHLHKGWSDVQHSVNRNFPRALRDSQRSMNAGLRSLARARKVRL